MARAASLGPEAWSLMTSTRSGMPLRSSSSYDSEVRFSTVTVTAENGFFCFGVQQVVYGVERKGSLTASQGK